MPSVLNGRKKKEGEGRGRKGKFGEETKKDEEEEGCVNIRGAVKQSDDDLASSV
jgi:hypothetical protein